jgi:NAD(P)-dependent dehydrogenase (short-subunit alcohol dehydrogenase family)
VTASFFADANFRSSVLSKIKLGRLAGDDIVGAAVFPGSEAARSMTGASLVVDAGWTAD